MVVKMADYVGKDGFLDIPRMITDGSQKELFPRLLPNIAEIREKDFPLFERLKRVYLDSTATSQEPQSIKDKMYKYRSNNLRGSNHSKNSAEAREAQKQYDAARTNLVGFFSSNNYLTGFTGGTTDTSNWIATRFPFEKGDRLILTEAEHNSQILTVRNIASKYGVEVRYVACSKDDGRLDLSQLRNIMAERKSGKTLLNLVHVSNVTGVVNPVEEIREIMGDDGFIYLDMAQSAGHKRINLDKLDVDFAGISSHKMYGPEGIGAIFINNKSARHIPSLISGGSAVNLVSKHFTVDKTGVARFEPGTQDLEGAMEWKLTIDYLNRIGIDNIEAHDRELTKYFIGELEKIDGVRVYGPKSLEDRTAVVSFNIGSFTKKNYDLVARELDSRGISVRDGCFCTHILTAKIVGLPRWVHEVRTGMMKLGLSADMLKLPGAVRASFSFYNNLEDAHKAVSAIREISKNG